MSCYLFVTGRLAAQALRDTLKGMPPEFQYEIAVLPISTAALMDVRFILRHLSGVQEYDYIMIPGLCRGDWHSLAEKLGAEVICGPKNLKDIPAFLGSTQKEEGFGAYRVKIFAEIVDAYQMRLEEILARAEYFRNSGADVIDLGCPVEGRFNGIDNVINALKSRGFTVSIDTFNSDDIIEADRAGVDFLLSINSRNIDLARRLHCKVVVIPDFDTGLDSLERNITQLKTWRVPYIIDPILNPIGFGFVESIGKFMEIRRRHPEAEMLMGIGNVTELTDADSIGINAVLAGIVEELNIDYVLTTEVVSWTRGAVREFDLARKLMYHACKHKILPKHIDDGLITIKDSPFKCLNEEELRSVQAKIRDRHFRIFIDGRYIYIFNNQLFIKATDIDAIFRELGPLDAQHAFYIGKELQKALLAVQLGKEYLQDADLRWGYLTKQAT